MNEKFNIAWNAHYDFGDSLNAAEIESVDLYDVSNDTAVYSSGEKIDSPWGSNRVVAVELQGAEEICIKEITVKPGFMLSLQRHRGRAELWEVKEGTLGVIADGEYLEVPAGQSITLPKGCVHCMINPTRQPVTVRETQRGICREKDNIRLVDSNNRPTYPLTSEKEFLSAKLYRDIQKRLSTQSIEERA